jgi:hypothetical protein
MKHREKALQSLAMEHRAYQFEFPILITQAITMCQVEFLTIDFASHWLVMNDYSTFLFQVIATPNIMITDEEMHFHAHIGQFGNLTEETGISFGHYHLEFIPKVEHVAQQIDSTCLVLDAIQEIHQATLLRTAMFDGTRPQMGIGKEIDILHGSIHL